MDVRSLTQIINDEGSLGVTARASLRRAATKIHHWPMKQGFHSQRGQVSLCPFIIARKTATLFMADLHPTKGPDILSGNQISILISSRIPIDLDNDGCPLDKRSFPQATVLIRKLALLWEHGVHTWAQILCRGPDGRLYFPEERELQWANPPMHFTLPEALALAVKCLRAMLSSTDSSHW